MKSRQTLTISLLSLALVASLAWALPVRAAPINPSILYSPPLTFEEGSADNAVACNIVNISNQTREVVLELRGDDGAVVVTDSEFLAPGAVFGIADDPGGSNPAYCKFLVQGLPGSFRASACIVGGGAGCVPAGAS